MRNSLHFCRRGNIVGSYQGNSGIERRFQNWGQIMSGRAFLKLLLTNENISKHGARQSKLALSTP